jgi:hypothetical protein
MIPLILTIEKAARLAFGIVLLWACGAFCQVLVEPEVTTDSIDIFQNTQKSTQSPGLALAASLLLPGLGHEYLGEQQLGLVYFTAEAALVCGLVFSEATSRRLFASSRSYASLYAQPVQGTGPSAPATDENFWQNVGRFMDSDEFNRVMEYNRTPEDKYSGAGQAWRWPDESLMNSYNGLRDKATRYHVASSFCLAAMVLDRAIAFIDIRARTRHKNITAHTAMQIRPCFSPFDGSSGITLAGAF